MGWKHKQGKGKKHCFNRRGTYQRQCYRNPFIDYKRLIVVIKESALQKLHTFRQIEDSEVGGVFTGSELCDDYYRIGKISDPCVFIHSSSKCTYIRDARLANSFIQQDFELSNHTRYYLGEWHTHPECDPKPSSIDYESIREIYNTSDLTIGGVFLIIVGLNSNYYGFYDGVNLHEIKVEIC